MPCPAGSDDIPVVAVVTARRNGRSPENDKAGRNCNFLTLFVSFLFQEPFWNVELWPLDAREMERRCSSRNLWTQVGSPAAVTGTGTAGNRYWEHEVAIIESRSDLISLLVGLLSFRRGRWELLDNAGSVEVVASEGDCLQFRDRVVFATSFSVHREAFTPADCGGSSTYQRVYLGIDDFQPATMPLARPEQEKREESCPDEGEGSVRFLALDKSMPLSLYVNQPAIRRIFGYLVLASLHSDVPEGSGTKLTKRHCSWTGSRSSSSQAERANNPEGPAKCLLFFAHDHPSLGYPELIEGRVYVIRLSRRKLLTNPYGQKGGIFFLLLAPASLRRPFLSFFFFFILLGSPWRR